MSIVLDSKDSFKWHYDRGDGRYKHCWNKPYAGFVPGYKGSIGKCSCNITQDIAQNILNKGIPFFFVKKSGREYPRYIYCVYGGVIYEAVPTVPGISYHGYPWRGDLKGRTKIPHSIMKKLRKIAEEDGFLQEFDKWKKTYGK